MRDTISYAVRTVLAGTAAAAVAFSLVGTSAIAEDALAWVTKDTNSAKTVMVNTNSKAKKKKRNKSITEEYIPTIWIDPDGCEHWVMDDGAEGYMTPHTNRQGIPVCRRGNLCSVLDSDQLFRSGSAAISAKQRKKLQGFFSSDPSVSYIITGHTDSDASDAYNMKLSFRRASAVAEIAKSAGSKVADIRGYGERFPVASNKTASGKAKNRRVEIACIQ